MTKLGGLFHLNYDLGFLTFNFTLCCRVNINNSLFYYNVFGILVCVSVSRSFKNPLFTDNSINLSPGSQLHSVALRGQQEASAL